MCIAIASETLCSDSSDIRQPAGTVNLSGDEHGIDCKLASNYTKSRRYSQRALPPPPTKKEKVFMDSFSFAFQVNADSICANCGWRTIPNYSRKLHCSIQTLLIRNHAAHFYLHIPFGADLNQVSIHKTGGREIMYFH